MIAPELEARDAMDWKAVVAPFRHQQVEDREALGGEELGPRWLKPGQYLALRLQQAIEAIQQRTVPGTGGDHQPVGLVHITVGGHAHALAKRLPFQHAFAAMDLGPERLR